MSNVYTFYLGKELEKILKRSFKDNLDIIKILLKTVEKLLTPTSDTLNIDRTSEEGRDIFKITYPDLDGESQQRIFYYSSHDDYNGQKMFSHNSVFHIFDHILFRFPDILAHLSLHTRIFYYGTEHH